MDSVIFAGLLLPIAVLAAASVAWIALGAPWAILVLVAGGGGIIAFHLWHLRRLQRWAEGSFDAPVPEGRGSWRLAFSALYRRVRTRSAHQRDLAHTIERFMSAAEAIPDGMAVVDSTHRIRWVNARGQQHFGLDPSRDVGVPIVNLVRQPEFVRYLDVGDFTNALVIESQRTAGTTLAIQVVPFGVDEKLLISRDITQLEAVARMRRDFIANVSHELKTPLTVVSGFLETLQDLKLDPRQQRRYVDLMAEQARSMERLVNDLLTLSGLESEQNPPLEAPFAIVPLLLELSADAKALSNGGHDVVLDIRDPATVTGSRDELASAFGNLVSNAIRYTPAGGSVTLAWHREGDERDDALFSVADTGIGLAPEHLPRLTERFYRVDRSRSRATGGTGLGLAIVKHVLLRHQATMVIESELGRGSRFCVRIPARRVNWQVTEAPVTDAAGAAADPAPPVSTGATSS